MKRYNVFLRQVVDTMGNFETFYGWEAKKELEKVSYRKALAFASKKWSELEKGQYYEIYCVDTADTLALFGYFNHKGKVKQ